MNFNCSQGGALKAFNEPFYECYTVFAVIICFHISAIGLILPNKSWSCLRQYINYIQVYLRDIRGDLFD